MAAILKRMTLLFWSSVHINFSVIDLHAELEDNIFLQY